MKPLFSIALASIAALAAGGCQSTVYPLGIYAVPEKDLATVRQAGFNLVVGPATPEYLEASRRAGLKVLASPGTSAGKRFDPARARAAVARFDRDPALWGWYVVDEPDLNLVPPDQVRDANRFIKDLGAIKPTALVIYNGASALDYANIADVTMIDRYPIPWLPLANYQQHLMMTRLALGRRRPMIAVIQAFDWSADPGEIPEPDLRPPTFEEMRCMAYCALLSRAAGIFFYAYHDSRWNVRDHPEVWSAVKKIAAEIRAREPFFQADQSWWPYISEFVDVEKRFNGALILSVTPALLRVKRNHAGIAPGQYVLAVNTTPEWQGYSVRLPFPIDGDLPAYGEHRAASVTKRRWLEDDFRPFAIHIYGPLPEPNSNAPRRAGPPLAPAGRAAEIF